ncbi:MAG: GTPase ObgE, partial [FCB group bacterium]|nr:GTPase ObgE [FCB group bacterium]
MIVDRARIKVEGGAGGNGCTGFRREKYVPRGGPDGGDGGNGGDIVFVADSRLDSLLDLQYHSTWKGDPGGHGSGSNCHGKNGSETIIRVPPGTVFFYWEGEVPIGEVVEDGERFVAAKGGRGGRGNARFTSSTNRAPNFAEKGEPGEEFEYRVELKTIAEVGLVGLPNAGKSTFLAAATAARPKIADYPFTTLSPNLGIAYLSEYRRIKLADIPGIIEGAAEGKGLGHDFLRHIERTKVLLFIIDLGDPDPLETRDVLERELEEYGADFSDRPRVYALNKADIPENRARFEELAPHFENAFLISAAGVEGIDQVLEALWDILERLRSEEPELEPSAEREYTFEAPYTIVPIPEGFRLEGKALLRAARMTDWSNEQAVDHFQRRLRKMGILRALKRMGAQEGQAVFIGDV